MPGHRYIPALYLAIAISGVLSSTANGQGPARPFPVHATYKKGILPRKAARAVMDDSVRSFFKAWKQQYLRYNEKDSTWYIYTKDDKMREDCVSEAIGYGMMIMALMADSSNTDANRRYFDGLYKFCKRHPSIRDKPGSREKIASLLMAEGQVRHKTELRDVDKSSAADGDIDIAYALILAARQWPGRAAAHYRQEAARMIHAILDEEINIDRHTIISSNQAERDGSDDYNDFRSSDFIPAEIRAFRDFSRQAGDAPAAASWQSVLDANYSIFSRVQLAYAPRTGLFADFYQWDQGRYMPGRREASERVSGKMYYFNACRVPWRIGVDYLVSGDDSAYHILSRLNRWIKKATDNDPARINAGYRLDGTIYCERKADCPDTMMMSFIAPFAVSAMSDASHQAWLDSLWDTIVRMPVRPNPRDKKYGDLSYGYFENTLKLLCLVVLSGNYWTPARPQ